MWKKLATATGVLGLVLVMATTADAQRRGGGGGGGRGGSSWGGSGSSWGGSGSHWGGHDGFSIYAPGAGFSYGNRGYYGSPYYAGGNYGSGYYSPYYGGYYSEPYFSGSSQPYYSSNMPYSQGYEEADQGAQPAITKPRGDETMVRVLLPTAGARVTFDGNATQQRGMDRVFISELPDRNKDFTYMVRAMWTEDGREMKRDKKVKVRAGQQVTVDFRQESGTGGDGTINREQNRDNNRDEGTTTPRLNNKNRDDTQPDRQP